MLSSNLAKTLTANIFVAGMVLAVIGSGAVAGTDLPRGMVYLKHIDATIAQDIRYAGVHNFMGRPVRGYQAAECILSMRTAKALARIQTRLRRRELSLKVYDCYRPMRAVHDFVSWARDKRDQKRKVQFYPHINKRDLFALRYISKRSTHTRGNTVDLTLIPRGSKIPPFKPLAVQRPCHLTAIDRNLDNSLDFGTGYDCFHKRSGRGLERRYKTAHANRAILNRLMRAEGFKGYFREWWHFKLPHAGARRAMNFPIQEIPAQ